MFEHERAIRSVLAGIILACFLMPFCNITNGDRKIASVTGTDLVWGTEFNLPGTVGDQRGMTGAPVPSKGTAAQLPIPGQPGTTDGTVPADSIAKYVQAARAEMPEQIQKVVAGKSTIVSQPGAVAAFIFAIVALVAALVPDRRAMLASAIGSGLVAVGLAIVKPPITDDLPFRMTGILNQTWTDAFWAALMGSALLALFTAQLISSTKARHKAILVIQAYTEPTPPKPTPTVKS
ncbi:MAG: hypothetical protein HY851_08665 [candidate division Zixibacteria bacterium]|nr:hypothetical protein [candidate division Zixibacteria bacterium]